VIGRIGIRTENEIGIATGDIGPAVEIAESDLVLVPRIAEIGRGVVPRRRIAAPEEENRPCIGMCRHLVLNTSLLCRQDYLLLSQSDLLSK